MNIIGKFQLNFCTLIQTKVHRLLNEFKDGKLRILFLFRGDGEKKSNMTTYFISKFIEIESSQKQGIYFGEEKIKR